MTRPPGRAGLAGAALAVALAVSPTAPPLTTLPGVAPPTACIADPTCLVSTTASGIADTELLTVQQAFTARIANEPTVLVYGDSYATESAAALRRGLTRRGWQLVLKTFPGTGICDWLTTMQTDGQVPVRVVVLTFSGNVLFTPCTVGDQDGPASVVAATFWKLRGATVVWASAPGRVGTTLPSLQTETDQILAPRYGQRFVDAGATLRAPDGSYPTSLPCRRSETRAQGCRGGTIRVRVSLADGHLCPVAHPGLTPCPVYSSGIARWVGAIASVVAPLERSP